MMFVTGALWRIFVAWEFVQLSFVLAEKLNIYLHERAEDGCLFLLAVLFPFV